jgi:hypothetical protein
MSNATLSDFKHSPDDQRLDSTLTLIRSPLHKSRFNKAETAGGEGRGLGGDRPSRVLVPLVDAGMLGGLPVDKAR